MIRVYYHILLAVQVLVELSAGAPNESVPHFICSP